MKALPTSRQLACFIAIVREGTIGRAAKSLSLTQPALSRTLTELESILNARLMERSRGGITLTPAGETFLRYASASHSALERGLEQIAQIRNENRRAVAFGVLPTAASDLAPRAVAKFKVLNPDVPVRVVPGTNKGLAQLVRQGDLDFFVGRQPAPEDMPGLVFDPLFTEEQVAVVCSAHPLANVHDAESIVASLEAYPILLPLTGAPVRRSAERMLFAAGVTQMTNLLETNSAPFAFTYLEIADAIWIAPRGVVEAKIASGELCVLSLDASGTRGTIGITRQSETPISRLAAQLCSAMRELTRDR